MYVITPGRSTETTIDAGLQRIVEIAQAIWLPLVVQRDDLLVHSPQWSQDAFLVGTHVSLTMLDVIASGPVPGCLNDHALFGVVLGETLDNAALQDDGTRMRVRLHAELCDLCDVVMHFAAEESPEEEERMEIGEEDVDEDATAMQQDAMAAAPERARCMVKRTLRRSALTARAVFGFIPRR
jgi:hypothetical protein